MTIIHNVCITLENFISVYDYSICHMINCLHDINRYKQRANIKTNKQVSQCNNKLCSNSSLQANINHLQNKLNNFVWDQLA